MNFDCEEKTSPPQVRGRNNTKSKVLVRSHAMREEASPPREPTPTSHHRGSQRQHLNIPRVSRVAPA
ncbi:SUZ domain [Popillia japonica]|uniref:SUZ domain n=1 Tax=Popillia japonica TaxID=7064 RepID=A0AAW1MFG1_POPJA